MRSACLAIVLTVAPAACGRIGYEPAGVGGDGPVALGDGPVALDDGAPADAVPGPDASADAPPPAVDGGACLAGFTDCHGLVGCVDLMNDSSHCGNCQRACVDPAPICCGGTCQPIGVCKH